MKLNPQQQALLDTRMTMLIDPTSDEIPESVRDTIVRGFGTQGFNTALGLACTVARDDLVTLIVTRGDIEPETLQHEFIHCAQVYASNEIMHDCLVAAEAIGKQIIELVRQAIATKPELQEQGHRDLLRITTAWEFTKEQGPQAVPSPHALFDTFMSYYPTPTTRALAASLGFENPDGVYAAITAAILKEINFAMEPKSDLAREIIAYTFQSVGHPAIDALFDEATSRAEKLREQFHTDHRPGR